MLYKETALNPGSEPCLHNCVRIEGVAVRGCVCIYLVKCKVHAGDFLKSLEAANSQGPSRVG
jgi:hypothetical protein